jgi:hypothetical protein
MELLCYETSLFGSSVTYHMNILEKTIQNSSAELTNIKKQKYPTVTTEQTTRNLLRLDTKYLVQVIIPAKITRRKHPTANNESTNSIRRIKDEQIEQSNPLDLLARRSNSKQYEGIS